MEFGLYQHHNGKFYQVFELAHHSETQEEMVVYQALYGDFGIWVKPRSLFDEKITAENGKLVPKYALIMEDSDKDNEDDDYLTVFDNEMEMKQAAKKLEASDISFDMMEEELKPKPEHLRSNILYKLFVDEEDAEKAMLALRG